MELIISDQHAGLVKAIRTHYQGVTWQRCQTHFMRNILDKTPKALKEELYPKLRAILDAPDLQTARLLFSKTVETYQDKIPKAMETFENGFDDATAVLMLPEKYRKRLRTTNAMERLNQEIRRRERVIGIFPIRESLVRLIGALLIEFDKKWASSRRYFDMAEFESWANDRPNDIKKITRIG